MEKICFDRAQTVTENGTEIYLTYYLIVDEVETGGCFSLESYGAGVEKRCGGESTYTCCRFITFSQIKIEKLLRALVRGTVTPLALADVVEDWE